MKKIFISMLAMVFSANGFAAANVEKENMYCFSLPQKQGVYVCKPWSEWAAAQTDSKVKIEKVQDLNTALDAATAPVLAKNKRLTSVEARNLLEHGDKTWMIQIALAANEANADSIVSKLKAKGYPTKKSMTSKGVRVMVGPNDYQTASELKKKIQGDNSLGAKSAWLFNWGTSLQ
ncbi:SPOR domain-containing protein [Acinetobacter sp. ANC 4641]|uniref:SPOR domain-containing protein n=1 Tax=Acinetobacter sp. ANC 4641 TaxID=2529847 RepID=UPI00103C10C7|nr:SPOR domain-containing protein [Acinetobacter sp. ANC 4641]TCB12708.1 SPOR domain-containing protein [Acinetobacter sp. ANC 4641]